MKSSFENGVLTVYFSGKIDSANAEGIGSDVAETVKEYASDVQLVFDVEELEYISSAGLRMVLKFRKQYPSLKIINANTEVYEVFDMTGFTEMLKVEKAYRKLSVDGCTAIGRGANGTVYRLNDEIIIKVYNNPDSLPDIQRERELARKAFVLGIPTAIPYDVVKVGESYGSVFELLNADSFAGLIAAEPENVLKYTELYADLLKKIHSTVVKKGDMPDMKAVAVDWAAFLEPYIPQDKFQKLMALVNAVPESDNMLHGDYHLKNVMMQNGEVLLIDMDTLCVGDPVFEFGSVFLAYKGYYDLDREPIKDFLGIDYDTAGYIWDKTLELYFGTDDKTVLQSYADKAMIIGYTRLLRRTVRRNGLETESGRAIIENARTKLCELIDRVDSLSFVE